MLIVFGAVLVANTLDAATCGQDIPKKHPTSTFS